MMKRNFALDVFRGITIFLMIIVNSLPSTSNWTLLKHSRWNGCTLADLVFPFFLIILGFTHVIRFSTADFDVSKILKRFLKLIFIGLFLNAFPLFIKFRIPGVLQRIALCYLVIAILHHYCRPKTQWLMLMFILIFYYLFNLYYPTSYWGQLLPGYRYNHIGYVDQILFGQQHLLHTYFDPEGLVSSIPATASTIFGALLGYCYQKNTKYFMVWLIGFGGISITMAYLWQPWCPINKSIWSSTYVLWTGGMACFTFALILFLAWFKRLINMLSPFEWLGRHSLATYVISVILIKLFYVYPIKINTML